MDQIAPTTMASVAGWTRASAPHGKAAPGGARGWPGLKRCLGGLSVVMACGVLPGAADGVETGDCVILAGAVVDLGAQAQGLLEQVSVEENGAVTRGQIVASLHAERERAALDLAILRAEDESRIRTAEIRLAFEKERLARASRLARSDILSDEALAERRAEYDLAEAELSRTRVEQREAQLQRARAAAELEVRRIRSPIDGVVVDVMLDPGEFVREDTPVMRIARIRTLKVEVFLPQTAYDRITAASVATITPESGTGPAREARVRQVDRLIDPASGTFGVELALDNSDGAIVAGVRCEAAFRSED